MKVLGFIVIFSTIISFVFRVIHWSYFRFFVSTYSLEDYATHRATLNIFIFISAVSELTGYLAILLSAILIILLAKRLPKN